MATRKYDRVMWDFNGTVLDDLDHCLRTANELLGKYGKPPLTKEEYREVFTFPITLYYERIGLPGEGEGYVKAAHEWVALYRAGEGSLSARPGVREAIKAIGSAGIVQSVLSATEAVMLKEQVAALGLTDAFDGIYGRGDIYASDKSGIARAFRESHPGERVLMVGDTLHDLETAKAGGFDCALVLGGHQSERVLSGAGCPVFPDFGGLLSWLGL